MYSWSQRNQQQGASASTETQISRNGVKKRSARRKRSTAKSTGTDGASGAGGESVVPLSWIRSCAAEGSPSSKHSTTRSMP